MTLWLGSTTRTTIPTRMKVDRLKALVVQIEPAKKKSMAFAKRFPPRQIKGDERQHTPDEILPHPTATEIGRSNEDAVIKFVFDKPVRVVECVTAILF